MREQITISVFTLIFSLVISFGFGIILATIFHKSIAKELIPLLWMEAKHGLPTDQIIIVRYADVLENDWICYKDFEWYYAELNGKKVDPEKVNKITHYSYIPQEH